MIIILRNHISDLAIFVEKLEQITMNRSLSFECLAPVLCG